MLYMLLYMGVYCGKCDKLLLIQYVRFVNWQVLNNFLTSFISMLLIPQLFVVLNYDIPLYTCDKEIKLTLRFGRYYYIKWANTIGPSQTKAHVNRYQYS